MKWFPSTIAVVAATTLMNATTMAQTAVSSSNSNRIAALAQRFDATERDWQQESMSSASAVEPMDHNARASDSRANVEQMWRDKFVAHAMESGDVANAAVNTPRFQGRAAADPVAPLARMSAAEQNAYYESIARDAKP